MSSTPTLPQTRLFATQPPERVPTQRLDANDSAKTNVQENWENGLFECCKPSPGPCFYAFFCPCMVYGRTFVLMEKVSDPDSSHDKHFNHGCVCFCLATQITGLGAGLMAILQRYQVRKMYSIRGNVHTDIVEGICCTACALVQAEKEVAGREKRKSEVKEKRYSNAREKMEMRQVQGVANRENVEDAKV